MQFLKIGSGCVVDQFGNIGYQTLANKVEQIETHWTKHNVPAAIVVSGAIALGKMLMKISRPNSELSTVDLQTYATVGQTELISLYARMSSRHVGQVLVTESDMEHPNDIKEVLKNNSAKGVLTLINYNDGIVSDEVRKDNDTIAAKLLGLVDGSRLVILGNGYDGMYDKNHRLITHVSRVDEALYAMCNGKSHGGNGGFETKLHAAEIILKAGKEMIVGNIKYDLDALIEGSVPRTLFRGEI